MEEINMYYVWLNSITKETRGTLRAGFARDNPWFSFVSDYFLYNEPVPKEIPPLPINYVTDDNPKLISSLLSTSPTPK